MASEKLYRTALKGLFTWSGGPRYSGVGFFCFHALGETKQKKPTPLDRVPPRHVNRVLVTLIFCIWLIANKSTINAKKSLGLFNIDLSVM